MMRHPTRAFRGMALLGLVIAPALGAELEEKPPVLPWAIAPAATSMGAGFASFLHVPPVADAGAGCRYPSEPLESVRAVPPPNYFFKICPQTGEYFYATGTGSPGFRAPGHDGDAHRPLPGSIDPVPSTDPGCRVLASINAADAVSLYDMDAAKAQGAWTRPLLVDPELSGVYESTASMDLRDADGHRTMRLRVLVDREASFGEAGLLMRDYAVSHPKDGAPSAKIAGPVRKVCANDPHYADLRMPMMSPDGRKISFFDTIANEGVVVNVDDEGNCAPGTRVTIDDPGFGKAAFSADGNRLAYSSSAFTQHARSDGGAPTYYMAISQRGMNAQIKTLDLRTGRGAKITDWADANSLYPSWNGDRVVAQRERFGADGRLIATDFVTLAIDPVLPPDLARAVGSCTETPRSRDAILQLAALWSGVCERDAAPGMESSLAAVLRLPADKCAEMVRTQWAATEARIGKRLDEFGVPAEMRGSLLTAEDLAAACPGK